MIKLSSYNEIYYSLDTDYEINNNLNYYFSIRAPGFFFNPKYKSGIWDGYIHLYKDNLLFKGLYNDLKKYCINNNIELIDECIDKKRTIDDESLNEFIASLKLSTLVKDTKLRKSINPYEHQIEAVKLCLTNNKQLIESITSSGKSLIIYILIRYLQNTLNDNEKILVIVPSINLVNQMYDDFNDYSYNDSWDVKDYCCKVCSTSKEKNKENEYKIIISTWQSLKSKDANYFKQFKVVIDDEAHGAKADILARKLSLCVNSKYRFGFTGTVPSELLYKKQILGIFVNHNILTTYEQCLQDDIVTPVNITCLVLKYDISQHNDNKISYINEVKYIQGSDNRHRIIQKLAQKDGNTLILFNKVENHSKVIYEKMLKNEDLKHKEIYIIDASTNDNERLKVKELIDTKNNIIILATYALLSTGWSVNNLNNIIYADPTKSEIYIPQSLGRGMRKAQDKTECIIYDIVDKFNYKNFLLKHFEIRKKIYNKKKYNFKVVELKGTY